MRRAVIALMAIGAAYCQDIGPSGVPIWVLRGILHVETRSSIREDGIIIYVDKRRGAHGERGPFQCTRIAFEQVRDNEKQSFSLLERDPVYAEYIACKYLAWLYNRHHSWRRTVEEYNAGPGNKSPTYYNKVKGKI